jgi:hypothetical protein
MYSAKSGLQVISHSLHSMSDVPLSAGLVSSVSLEVIGFVRELC